MSEPQFEKRYRFAAASDDGVSLVAQLEEDATAIINAGESMVRVIHLSPDAPAVDVYANDGESAVVSELAYGSSTAFLAVPSGSYNFHVTASGGAVEDAVLNINDNIVLPGNYYTAVAYGELSDIQSIVLMDDMMALGAENLRVRAIHTAQGVGEVDIWNITMGMDAGILWENVPLSAAGVYYDLPAGEYSVGFDVDNDLSPDVSFDLPSLTFGTIANVFAVNDGAVKLIAQLWDGTTVEISAK